ncbi:MAG: ATP-dependent DNA helicase, partial [Methanosarcinaceae archaeon]|nr:ATP-dependent DNA helicase [Methanosarcinaceae archaeon]
SDLYLSNITQLEKYYPTLKKIPLEVNYRATSQLVETALQLISRNPTRQEKTLLSHKGSGAPVKAVRAPDDMSEAEWVGEEIERLIREKGVGPGKIFVLTRKRKDGKKFSEALSRRMIPAEYVGSLRLSHFPVIRQALAYMHVVADPFNSGLAFTKVLAREGVHEHNLQNINTSARRFREMNNGRKAADPYENILKKASKIPFEGDGVYTVLSYQLEELDLSQESLVRSVLMRINNLLDYKKQHLPSDTLKYLLNEKTDLYRAQLARDSAGARRNIALLKNLVTMVEDLENLDGKSDFEEVVEYLDLVFGLELEQEVEGEADTVKIMTIHQSKGREAEAVFVCDLAERHLPIDHRQKQFTVPSELSKGTRRSESEKFLHLEEERRLAYVGMTRAEKALYLVFPEKYPGNRRPSKPSIFLEEIGFRENPEIEFIEAKQAVPLSALEPESPLQKKIGEYERLVSMYSRQNQLKQALEALVVLARLREFEEKGSLTAFDPESFLKVDPGSPGELEALIREELPPLLNRNFAFSASGIKDYLACPLRFKYGNVLKIPLPRKIRARTGTDVHALFEELARRQKSGKEGEGEGEVKGDERGGEGPCGPELSALLLEEFRKNSVFASKTEEKQTLAEVRAMLDYWLRFEEDNPNEIFEVESSFEFELGTRRFTGKIDRLDLNPAGDYVLLDYKSGKTSLSRKELEEDLQLALYCEAVRKKYGKFPVKAGHMYVHPDLEKVLVFPVDPAKVEEVLEKIKETVEVISEEDFKVRAEPNCYYCDYKGICEHYNKNL